MFIPALVTLFGLTFQITIKREKKIYQRESADIMWGAVLALYDTLPMGATTHFYVPIKGNEYVLHKKRISDEFPISREEDETFLSQWCAFNREAQRQKPYIPDKLFNLLMDYSGFLLCTVTTAKYYSVLDDIKFPWEQRRERRSALSRQEKRRSGESDTGFAQLRILQDAICKSVKCI